MKTQFDLIVTQQLNIHTSSIWQQTSDEIIRILNIGSLRFNCHTTIKFTHIYLRRTLILATGRTIYVADVRGRIIITTPQQHLDHLLTAPATITPLIHSHIHYTTQSATNFHNRRTPNSGFGLRLRTPNPSNFTYSHKSTVQYNSSLIATQIHISVYI